MRCGQVVKTIGCRAWNFREIRMQQKMNHIIRQRKVTLVSGPTILTRHTDDDDEDNITLQWRKNTSTHTKIKL